MSMKKKAYAKEMTVNMVFRNRDVYGHYIGITFMHFDGKTAKRSAVKFYCKSDSAMNILKKKSGDEDMVILPPEHFSEYQKNMAGKRFTGIFIGDRLFDFVDTPANKLNLDNKKIIAEHERNKKSGYYIVA